LQSDSDSYIWGLEYSSITDDIHDLVLSNPAAEEVQLILKQHLLNFFLVFFSLLLPLMGGLLYY
jgi:hypothetical protein